MIHVLCIYDEITMNIYDEITMNIYDEIEKKNVRSIFEIRNEKKFRLQFCSRHFRHVLKTLVGTKFDLFENFCEIPNYTFRPFLEKTFQKKKFDRGQGKR